MDDRPIPTSLSRGKRRAGEPETRRGINGGGGGVEVDTVGREGGRRLRGGLWLSPAASSAARMCHRDSRYSNDVRP